VDEPHPALTGPGPDRERVAEHDAREAVMAKVGTRDRMPIHHFGSWERLLREVLEHLVDPL
jgi:hypothetical protein